ncbi:hypothetical protein JL721_5324 [Aureococcus anophagefferens]|nr:hypothetical protein JL721_5324 [Aureococcus anophagefferens]
MTAAETQRSASTCGKSNASRDQPVRSIVQTSGGRSTAPPFDGRGEAAGDGVQTDFDGEAEFEFDGDGAQTNFDSEAEFEFAATGAAARLQAYGIDTVEKLAVVDVRDYPLVRLITGNQRPDKASTTIAKWRDIAPTFLAPRRVPRAWGHAALAEAQGGDDGRRGEVARAPQALLAP